MTKNNSSRLVSLADPEVVYEQSGGALVNHLNLPIGLDLDRIQVDVSRAERLTRWAGALQLVLASADLGGDRPHNYDIESVGGGMASAKGFKKRPDEITNKNHYIDDNNPVRREPLTGVDLPLSETPNSILAAYKADSVVLYLDTRALTTKVAESKQAKRGPLDEKVWATTLDKQVRGGLLNSANARYINERYFSGLASPVMSLVWYEDIYHFATTGEHPVVAGLAVGLKGMQMMIGTHRVRNGEARMRDHNWTTQIFTLARTDRLIATAATAKFGGRII
ncbi:MAG: hypothetical protein M3Q79_04800, partial [bacterium]|nr:hypothetical protein [bacterium]